MNQIRNARQNYSANGSNSGNGSFVFESRGNGQHTFRSGGNNGNNLPEGFWDNFGNMFKTAFPLNSNGSGSNSSGNDNGSGSSADARSFSDGNSANNSSGSFDSGAFRGNGENNFRFSSDNGNNLPEGFWENFDNMFKTLFPQNSSSSGNGNSGGNAGASAGADPDDSFAYASRNGREQNKQGGQEQHDFQDSSNESYEFPEELRKDFSGHSGESARPNESVKGERNGRDNARDGSGAGFADSFASASHTGKEQNKRDEQDDSQDGFNDDYDHSEEIWQDFLRKSREYTRTNGNTIDPDYAYNADNGGSYGRNRRQYKGHAAYRHKEGSACRFTHWEKEEFRRLNLSLDAAQRIMILHIIFIPAGLYLSVLSLGYLAFTAPAKIRQAEYFLEKCGYPESVRLCRRELKTMIFFQILAVLLTLGFIIIAAVSAGAAAGMLDYSQTAVWQLFLIPAVIWAVSLPFQIISFMTFSGIRKDLKNLTPPE